MVQDLKLISEAYDKLKEYQGENDYIIQLKNGVYAYQNISLNDFQSQFIIKNYDTKPKYIGKIAKIRENWSKKIQKKYNFEFLPKVVEIGYYLGEAMDMYVFYGRFRKSQKQGELLICPKDNILTDFLAEDYHNVQVDFDRYDKLASRLDPNRKITDGQKEGVQFLLSRKKCILADEPGYGKSLCLSVAAVEGNFDSIVLMCPASIKTKWKNELMYYVPERDITIIESVNGKKKAELEAFLGYGEGKSMKSREELLQEAKEQGKWKENRFIIVNFDIIDEFYKIPKNSKKSIEEAFQNSPLLNYILNKKSLLIIDEAHNLSNDKSIRYKVIQDLIKRGKPDSIYLATGTPVTNNPQNLYYVLKLINHPITENKEYYLSRYCGAKKICHPKSKPKRDQLTKNYLLSRGKATWYDLSQAQKRELQSIVEKNCWMMPIAQGATHLDELREKISNIYLRRVKADLSGLPPKFVHEMFYELTPAQQAEYEKLWDEFVQTKKEENPDKELSKELLEGAVYRKYISNAMVPYTENIVDKLLKRGEKVVIACCYDEELYTLQDYYQDKCVIFNGKINLRQKDDAVEQFNNGTKDVIICNIKSAGLGIDLCGARYMVFNNISYVPGDDRQMEDRIWRRVQKRDCHIVYQIFKNTQYEKMWDTVMKKELAINEIIKKEGEK